MATYQVTAPDGHVLKIDAPDGTSQDQVLAYVQQNYKPPTPQPSAQDRASAAGEAAGQEKSGFSASVQGMADSGTLGLSNYVNAIARYAGQRLTGVQNPDDYSTDLAYARGESKGVAAAHPYANIGGQITGTLLGAGAITNGVKLAAKVAPAIRTVADAIGFQPAQAARNILRAAGIGVTAGGIQAGSDTGWDPGQTTTGVAFGAGAGIVGLAAGPVVRKLLPASAKANAMLAKIIGEDPATIEAARNNFKAATTSPTNPNGTDMPMAALMSLKQQGALRDLANANPDVGLALSNAHDDVSAARPDRMADVLEGLMGAPQDVNTLNTHVNTQMTAAMKPIRGQSVTVDKNDLTHLLDPDAYGSLRANSPLKGKLSDVEQAVSQNGSDNSLTVDDIDNLRQAIRGRRAAAANPNNAAHNPHTANELGDLMDNVTNIATRQVPDYGAALDEYRSGQNYIDAFEHGLAGKSAGEADTPTLRAALMTAHGAQGHSAGVATRLISGAGDSERGANMTAVDLTQRGMQRLVGQTQSAPAAAGAAQLGTAETRAEQSLNAVAPSSIRPNDETSPQALLHGIAAATYHSPAGVAVHASRFLQALSGLKGSPATQKVVARYLTDPSMSSQAYNIMRKAGNTDADIRRFATGLSASLGSAAGETTSRGQ